MLGGRSPHGDPTQITLSTGEHVELPVATEATMYGAVYSVPRPSVAKLLPEGTRPIRATPRGRAAVMFLGVEYHHVDVPNLEPYNEFGILFPAVPEPQPTIPYLSALYRATSGYMWYLPVTTESAKAFGVDIWGYPKVVGDITHKDAGAIRQTTVRVDGQHLLTLRVKRSRSMPVTLDGYSYTLKDNESLYVPIEVDAEVGGWPLTDAVSLTLGNHPRADRLRDLGFDVGGRTLGRLSIDGTAVFHPGKSLATQLHA